MQDIFKDTDYGKAALIKMAPVSENFRLFYAGIVGEYDENSGVIKVQGAEFRKAKTGPRAGELVIEVKDTRKTAYITKDEMEKHGNSRSKG